jgi:NAD(P)-dependent dehydrogenase (short-subunit alcohol dehydrogenase family)
MNRTGSPDRGAVMITGVSSGIGLGMARAFLQHGHRVFGSVRSESNANELCRSLGEGFTPLLFDVRNAGQIERAAHTLRELLPEGRLAALINNAGSAEIGPLLHVSPDVLTAHLDTLVVGQLRVIQRFFGFLVASPATPGRIINISSISGTGANTFFGCYAAAKHALEGLSKTLREEIKASGVPVVVVAPSNIATSIWPKQRPEIIDQYRDTAFYNGLREKLNWIAEHAMKEAMSVEDFSRVVYDIFSAPAPAHRYTVDWKRTGWGPFSRREVTATAS